MTSPGGFSPGGSLLVGPVVALEVTEAGVQSTVYVHRTVLSAIPFLAAQDARWSEGALRLELPDGLSVDALALVLEKIYFPARSFHGLSMGFALEATQVAAMLDCSQSTVGSLILAVRDAVVTEEDVGALCSFCSAHQVPQGLARLAERLKRKVQEGLDREALQAMLENGLRHDDAEMLGVVERHLKQRSRRGGALLEEVADIIGMKKRSPYLSKEPLFALVSDFTNAHPRFYARMVDAMFNREAPLTTPSYYPQWSVPLAVKYFCIFLQIGIAHMGVGTLGIDDIVAFFVRTVEHSSYLDQKTLMVEPDCLSAVVTALPSMGSGLQLEVCRVWAMKCQIPAFCSLVRADLLQPLNVEAKAVFFERMVDLPDHYLKATVTEPILCYLTDVAKLKLCQKAYVVAPEVKTALLHFVAPDDEDSDPGF